MELSSSSTASGPERRFVVAVTVAVAAVAVTTGIVLNERHRAPDAPLARAEAGGGRHGPTAGPTSTLTADPPDAAGAHWDPALPPAAEALEGTSAAAARTATTK